MEKSIRNLVLLAILSCFTPACGDDDGGSNNEDAGEDSAVDDSGADAGDGGDTGPTCVTDTTTLPGQATFETNLRFLNQCTTAQYRDFDNTTRITHPQYVPGGPYPPLP